MANQPPHESRDHRHRDQRTRLREQARTSGSALLSLAAGLLGVRGLRAVRSWLALLSLTRLLTMLCLPAVGAVLRGRGLTMRGGVALLTWRALLSLGRLPLRDGPLTNRGQRRRVTRSGNELLSSHGS